MPQAQNANRPTPEQVNAAYHDKYITIGDRNEKMRRLAELSLDEVIGDQGMVKTYWTQTLKHVVKNWEEFIDIASKHDPEKSVGENIKLPFRLMWREVQMLMAGMTAFGEVNGATAKHWALDAGASPGLAHVIGVAVDVGSGFIPVGMMAKSFAKGVQGIGAAVKAKAGAKAVGAAVDEAAKLTAAEKIVDDAITQGLASDGVKVAGMAESAATKIPEAGNINKTFLDEFKEIKATLEGITETKSFEMAAKEADKLGLTVDDIRGLFPGKAINDAEVVAYLRALGKPIGEWVASAKKFDGANPQTVDEFLKNTIDVFNLTTQMRTTNVTAGRTVKYFDQAPANKSITEMLRHWDPESMAKLDRTAAAQSLAEDVLAMADEPGKLATAQVLAADALKDGKIKEGWKKFREGFNGLLLLRPVTWTRQFGGNSLAAMVNVVEKETGALFSIGEKKGLVQGEGLEAFKGMHMAMGEAVQAYFDAYKRNPAAQSRLDFPIHQIGGGFGRVIGSGSDTVRGIDNFFKTIVKNSEIYASAFRDANNLGLKGKAYIDYIARRRIKPMLENEVVATDIAEKLTFQQDLGYMGKKMQGLLQAGPLALYWPFVKSGVNLIKWGWNRHPTLQLASKQLYSDILAGGARADMAVARITLANMFGQFYHGIFQTGMGTGGGPVDPAERRAWLATHQPYSFKGADGNWYSFANTVEPGTTPLEMHADYAEIQNQLDDMTSEQSATAIALTVSRDILSNTWWQNAGRIVDLATAISHGEGFTKQGGELLAAPLTAIAQGGPLGLAIEREIDPIRRESRSWIDSLRKGPLARVFGYSKEMPPLRDGYGDPIMVPQAVGSAWLRKNSYIGGDFLAGLNNIGNPFTVKPGETDRIKVEGDRLGVKMPAFPWSTGGGKERDEFDLRSALPGEAAPVPLSVEERDRYIRIYRNFLREVNGGMEKRLLDTEAYKTAPLAAQREMFMNYLATSRSLAKDSLLVENIPLAKKVAEASAGKYLPMLQPQQRAKVAGDVKSATDLLDDLLPEQRDNLMRFGILDSGQARDEEVTGIKLEINKPITELNKAAEVTQ